jgi:hypothetical protein
MHYALTAAGVRAVDAKLRFWMSLLVNQRYLEKLSQQLR